MATAASIARVIIIVVAMVLVILNQVIFSAAQYLAVLKAKIKIKNPRIRAGIGPKPTISLGKWQSGPSPGTPRGRGGGQE